MGSKPRDVLRFAVGSPGGPKSRTWVIFRGRDGSIYVASRRLAGHLKASLHPSGRWRTGLTEEGAAKYPAIRSRDGDRALGKYERPEALADGVTMGFTVIVPASELRTTSVVPVDGKEIRWLPDPGPGRISQITIMFAPSTTPTDVWPARSKGADLIARFDLPTEAALVIHHERGEQPDERSRWETMRSWARAALESQGFDAVEEATEYGMLIEGTMTHGGPSYMDMNVMSVAPTPSGERGEAS